MSRLVGEIATHVVRQHRRLRRELPRFARLVDVPPADDGPAAHRAARRAVRFLDQEVLAHADVEDAVIAEVCGGAHARGDAARLLPYHDSLREATARLQNHLADGDDEDPRPSMHVRGFLTGVRDLLVVHLDDEWRTLVPLLAELPTSRASLLETLLPAAPDGARDVGIRTHLPARFAHVRAALSVPSPRLRQHLTRRTEAAIRRTADSDGIPLRQELGLRLELVPVVASERLALLVGRLRSIEMETVLAPVEFEVTAVRGGPHTTTLELQHTLTPSRRLPPDAPAHRLTATAIHALAGELGFVAAGHPRSTTGETR